jgi:hypothetical protein
MRKKIFVIAMVLTLTVAGGVVVAAGAGSGSSENVSATSASGTSVDEYEMYLVEDNPDLCVYSMRPNKTLLLIGASDWANYETYANVHTEEITGTPVALADDLSAVVIENDEGKFVVSTAEGEEGYPTEDGAAITPFDEADTSIEWNELYY